MSAHLYFTTDSSSFFFFFRRLIFELAERNLTKILGHMLGSKFNLKTHVQNLGENFVYNYVEQWKNYAYQCPTEPV